MWFVDHLRQCFGHVDTRDMPGGIGVSVTFPEHNRRFAGLWPADLEENDANRSAVERFYRSRLDRWLSDCRP
jgi:hypothetical protein